MLLRRLASIFASVFFLTSFYAFATIDPAWTTPQKPFRIAGNLYYVGSRDLASYLIITPGGDILINANLPSSPPQIRASVEALGFRWKDIKILLNSHAHFDHAGGSAEILRETHAKFMVMDSDVKPIESGGATDFDHLSTYPPAHVDRILHDGDMVELGSTVLTAHKTPGHTRGCATWTVQVKNSRGRTLNVVIVGGVAALSDYRLVATPGHPASYPGIARDFEHTFATLKALPCDIFLGAHGSYFGLQEKLAKLPTQGSSVWIDPAGYRRFVNESQLDFEHDLQTQKQKPKSRSM
jgi:metallo-beta-lactamase class B